MTLSLRRPTLSSLLGWHPEWWMLLLCTVAWAFMLAPLQHARSCCVLAASTSQRALMFPDATELADWMIMTAAMMLPMTLMPVRAAAFGSLWKRRHWAIAGFVAGYLGMWLLAGCVCLPVIHWVAAVGNESAHWIACGSFVAAAAWQCTSMKQRLAASCHRTWPLAPTGWPAHRDCLHFGTWHGAHCVANCGAAMAAAMLSVWHKPLMVGLTGLLLYDRYSRRGQSRLIAASLGAMAIAHVFAG